MVYDMLYEKKMRFYISNISSFAENLTSIISNLREKFDHQLEQLITEFAGVTEKSQRLLRILHRGHLDNKVKLTSYSHRQQRQLINAID